MCEWNELLKDEVGERMTGHFHEMSAEVSAVDAIKLFCGDDGQVLLDEMRANLGENTVRNSNIRNTTAESYWHGGLIATLCKVKVSRSCLTDINPLWTIALFSQEVRPHHSAAIWSTLTTDRVSAGVSVSTRSCASVVIDRTSNPNGDWCLHLLLYIIGCPKDSVFNNRRNRISRCGCAHQEQAFANYHAVVSLTSFKRRLKTELPGICAVLSRRLAAYKCV